MYFKYRAELPWALKNISIEMRHHEKIGIVGPTGGGKSTLVSLLQRFHDYQSGEIFLAGKPLRFCNRNDLRRQVGVVQQDPFLFRGTIASNVGLNDPNISQFQIEQALKLAGCGDWLLQIGGLAAPIEEKGANLSAGEKQWIAFARVLAFDPEIFIFDEATSNIDQQTEMIIQKAIRKVTDRRTTIIVAHRLNTLQICDRIAVIEDGELKAFGSHTTLIKDNLGPYYRLWSAQETRRITQVAPI